MKVDRARLPDLLKILLLEIPQSTEICRGEGIEDPGRPESGVLTESRQFSIRLTRA